jgi:hypothetical protein
VQPIAGDLGQQLGRIRDVGQLAEQLLGLLPRQGAHLDPMVLEVPLAPLAVATVDGGPGRGEDHHRLVCQAVGEVVDQVGRFAAGPLHPVEVQQQWPSLGVSLEEAAYRDVGAHLELTGDLGQGLDQVAVGKGIAEQLRQQLSDLGPQARGHHLAHPHLDLLAGVIGVLVVADAEALDQQADDRLPGGERGGALAGKDPGLGDRGAHGARELQRQACLAHARLAEQGDEGQLTAVAAAKKEVLELIEVVGAADEAHPQVRRLVGQRGGQDVGDGTCLVGLTGRGGRRLLRPIAGTIDEGVVGLGHRFPRGAPGRREARRFCVRMSHRVKGKDARSPDRSVDR